ncbi:MAG TPA: hypothetical protein VKG85_08495 [Actinomycetes bacterium]|nr:hypothetical protein [Actinomycetes bacterium]
MARRIGSVATTVATVILFLASCGGGGGGGDEVRTLSVDDVGKIILQPSDAPPGTTYDGGNSGMATAELLTQGVPGAAAQLNSLGLQGSQVSIFGASDGTAVGSAALVFPDAGAADRAMDVQIGVVLPAVASGVRPLAAADVGEESVAVGFASGPTGKPGGSVVFRVGNVMFFMNGSGPSIQPADLVRLAELVAARAEAV